MPVSASYLTFVLDQLTLLGSVRSKRMFGGVGLYSEDTFFAVIDDDVVYLRVDDASRADYEQRDMPQFCPVASKPELILKSYYQLPGEILDDPELLVVWAKRAVHAARTQAPSRPKKPRQTPAAREPSAKQPKKAPKQRGSQRAVR